MDTYRQGDVIIRAIKDATVEGNSSILARGERTGHAHRLTKGEWLCDGNGKIVVRTYALLEHEEHTTIRLPAGSYEYFLQRELDPLTLIERRVYD